MELLFIYIYILLRETQGRNFHLLLVQEGLYFSEVFSCFFVLFCFCFWCHPLETGNRVTVWVSPLKAPASELRCEGAAHGAWFCSSFMLGALSLYVSEPFSLFFFSSTSDSRAFAVLYVFYKPLYIS